MTLEDAVIRIIGEERYYPILNDMGIHWAVVAAMAQATTADDQDAIAFIRKWNDDRRKVAND